MNSMLDFLMDYGIKPIDYEYINRHLPKDIIDSILLSEEYVRINLAYYNSIGLTQSIANIIINRPDLIIIDNDILKELVNKIGNNSFINIVKESIDDLILLGI